MEQTLILIKPDGVERGLIGPIITRFEQRGLKLVGLKLLQDTTCRCTSLITVPTSVITPLTFRHSSTFIATILTTGETGVIQISPVAGLMLTGGTDTTG